MAATAVGHPDRFNGLTIELAGAFLTMPEVAEVLSAAWGRALTAPDLTPEEVLAEGVMTSMVEVQEWRNEVSLPARPDVARSLGFEMTALKDWAQQHRS